MMENLRESISKLRKLFADFSRVHREKKWTNETELFDLKGTSYTCHLRKLNLRAICNRRSKKNCSVNFYFLRVASNILIATRSVFSAVKSQKSTSHKFKGKIVRDHQRDGSRAFNGCLKPRRAGKIEIPFVGNSAVHRLAIGRV